MGSAFFTFIGAKGGAGTSTLCVELAKTMRDETNVVLVDADLSGRRSLGILTDAVRYLDAERAQNAGHVAQTRVNGVTLVELAASYESPFTLDVQDVERAASSIAPTGVVLADVPLPFTASVRPLVVRATRFIVVTEPSLLGITAARSMTTQLMHFGVPRARIAIVVTSRSSGSAMKRSEVERSLEFPVLGELPQVNDRTFARALAQLQHQLLQVLPEPTLDRLSASDTGQVRDRRTRKRDAGAGEAAESPLELSPAGDIVATPNAKVKATINDALAKQLDLVDAAKVQGDAAKLADLRARIGSIADEILKNSEFRGSAESIAQIKQEVVNEALGLGPLEEYLHHPDVTEIMVNGASNIYVEMNGVIHKTQKHFANEAQLRLIIERIIAPLGRRVDESVPMVDARLPDGSRVNAIIEPVALDGATLTIRRFGNRRLTADDLTAKGSVTPEVLDFLRACVEARLNMIISGGTGSGKTTFLNVLSSYLPRQERIVTIEDAAELLLNQPHVVRLESRPPNLEGKGQIAIRDLVRNSLRMRPDRIIVGEVRGPEALDMLQAMNTGHDGSLTTIHANSPRDAVARIETMVLMAGFDLPVRAIREQVSSAINVVVQTARLRDGTRKVTAVSEIIGMEGDVVTMHDIIRFAQQGIDAQNGVIGEYQYMGVQPVALQRFAEYGVSYDHRKLSALSLAAHAW
jgi:pilus assembly protein CpaF